jgi:Fe-Mn family superoxide dismutase
MTHTNLTYPYQLPELGYSYDALEPHIDARTMEIHHTKHHNGYVNNLNAALEQVDDLKGKDLTQILMELDSVPEVVRTAVRNNGGGHLNHALFWQCIQPGGATGPGGDLKSAMNASFGSLDQFKEQFKKAAMTRFGSGWAWLVMNGSGGLEICSTPNQDTPVMDGNVPILGIDVWEHAYYLKYQNRRNEYVDQFWNLVNWDVVSRFYKLHA